MKITTFKVPGRVFRQGGTIVLELDETKKEKVEENLITVNPSDIPKKATELAQDNDVQRTLAKGVLMMNQQEASVSVELKYLTD